LQRRQKGAIFISVNCATSKEWPLVDAAQEAYNKGLYKDWTLPFHTQFKQALLHDDVPFRKTQPAHVMILWPISSRRNEQAFQEMIGFQDQKGRSLGRHTLSVAIPARASHPHTLHCLSQAMKMGDGWKSMQMARTVCIKDSFE